MQVLRRPNCSARARRLGRLWVWGCALSTITLSSVAWAAPPPPPPGRGPDVGGGGSSAPPPPGRTSQTGADGGPREAPKIDQRTTSEDLTEAWGYSSTSADPKPNYVRSDRNAELSVNPIGYYQGVTVEGVNLPPYTAEELGVQPTVLTWTGFERSTNSSRAFFQLSSGTAYQVDRQGFLISLRLPNTSVSVRNNARRLDTSFFRSPLTEIGLRRDGADLVITLQLRREAAPRIEINEGQNGYKVLVVEFPDSEAELPGDDGPVDTSPASARPNS